MSTEPANDEVAVTPSDNSDLPKGPCAALRIIADGDVTYVTYKGSTVPVHTLTAGTVIPVRVRRVLATGTTATVTALYN